MIETYDNYAQTNIASGAFAFNGSWTSNNAVSGGTGGISFADFELGYGLNQSSVFNHNYGEAQDPGARGAKRNLLGLLLWRYVEGHVKANDQLRFALRFAGKLVGAS